MKQKRSENVFSKELNKDKKIKKHFKNFIRSFVEFYDLNNNSF